VTFRLERDGVAPLTLTPANGWVVRKFKMGYPSVRPVVDERPLADGTDDRTAYFGSRIVTLDLLATGNRQTSMDAIGPFVVPEARSYLYYQSSPGFERRILLRAASVDAPWDGPPGKLEMLVAWEAPNGTAETATQQNATLNAVVPPGPGFEFDLTFDLVFPEDSPAGSTVVTTLGNAKCYPVIRLYGPCEFPRIENYDDGRRTLDFDITLGEDDYLEVDVRAKTVLLNGNASQNRYQTLDFATSEWWVLRPGDNRVRYYPDVYSGSARAELSWRCQFI